MPLGEVIDKMTKNIQVISILPASPGNPPTLTFSSSSITDAAILRRRLTNNS